jgi:5'-methylthioadenosine phosphorylase
VVGGEAVTHEEVLRVFAANMATVRELVLGIVAALPEQPSGCSCSSALDGMPVPFPRPSAPAR